MTVLRHFAPPMAKTRPMRTPYETVSIACATTATPTPLVHRTWHALVFCEPKTWPKRVCPRQVFKCFGAGKKTPGGAGTHTGHRWEPDTRDRHTNHTNRTPTKPTHPPTRAPDHTRTPGRTPVAVIAATHEKSRPAAQQETVLQSPTLKCVVWFGDSLRAWGARLAPGPRPPRSTSSEHEGHASSESKHTMLESGSQKCLCSTSVPAPAPVCSTALSCPKVVTTKTPHNNRLPCPI
jgi:hypothetical protein